CALEERGRLDEAMKEFEQARHITPDSGWLRLGIGKLLKHQGHVDEAITELEAAAQLDPGLVRATAHGMLGDCWREKGSPQKALLEYNKSIDSYPDHNPAVQA